jgi:Na+/H+-dicarboxylate symporter
MIMGKKFQFSLSTNILIGMFLGIVCGIFFGEQVAFLQVAGNAFIFPPILFIQWPTT